MRYWIKKKRLQFKRYKVIKFLKDFMFIYRRVRFTKDKVVIPVDITEIIEYPDFEMWAIYNPEGEFICLHLDENSAANDCLGRMKTAKKLQSKLKS